MAEEQQNPYHQDQFIGIDNRNRSIGDGYVRDMENMLSTRDGHGPSRRDGFGSAFYTGTQVHSAWGDGNFAYLLFVADGIMYGISDTGSTPEELVYNLSSDPVSYVRVNLDVYWTDGQRCGVILPDGSAYPWACETPAGQPTLSAGTGGWLDAGDYQVAITYIDDLGRESGTGMAGLVSVPGNGVIHLTHIPQPADTSVVSVRVYASSANGDSLHHVKSIPTAMLSTDLSAMSPAVPLATQFQQPIQPGQAVTAAFARSFVARGSVLYWSDSLRYGQGVRSENYMRMSGRITVLAATGETGDGAGLYVVAGNRTYWLSGADPKNWSQVIAYPHGAIEGTLAYASGEVWGMETAFPVPSWLASNGQYCVGAPGGQVISFNANRATTDVGQYGASMVRDIDGQRVMATSIRGGHPSGLAFTETATTQVRRNGVLLP